MFLHHLIAIHNLQRIKQIWKYSKIDLYIYLHLELSWLTFFQHLAQSCWKYINGTRKVFSFHNLESKQINAICKLSGRQVIIASHQTIA